MTLALNEIWRRPRRWVRAHREAQLRTLVGDVIDDCNDQKRQAERLSRWSRHLNEFDGKAPVARASQAVRPGRAPL